MEVVETKPVVRQSKSGAPAIAIIVIALVVGVGGFIGGMQYQKSHGSSALASANQAAGPGGSGQFGSMGGRQMNGSFGTVSAVSSTSITVKDDRSGTSKTYSISSATTITDDGTTKAASDISVGDNVMVRTSSSTSTTATSIRINPTMGGPGMDGSTSADSSSSST